MTTEDVNATLKAAQEGLTSIQGKHTDEDITAMFNALSIILLNILYDAANS